LNKHVPGEGELVSAEETVQAEELIDEGHPDDAVALLEDAIAKDPGNDEARYDLIKLLLAEGQVEAAKHVFLPIAGRATGPVPEARPVAFSRYIASVQAAREGRSPAELSEAIAANKRDFEARFALAQLFWAAGQPTQAMDELLEIIMRDKTWHDQAARKTYVAILEVLTVPPPKPVPARGPAGAPGAHGGQGAPGAAPKLEIAGKVEVQSANPLIDQYRRKLSMALN
jgi:putative thioredoxin